MCKNNTTKEQKKDDDIKVRLQMTGLIQIAQRFPDGATCQIIFKIYKNNTCHLGMLRSGQNFLYYPVDMPFMLRSSWNLYFSNPGAGGEMG
jgi:hypothetical protein